MRTEITRRQGNLQDLTTSISASLSKDGHQNYNKLLKQLDRSLKQLDG